MCRMSPSRISAVPRRGVGQGHPGASHTKRVVHSPRPSLLLGILCLLVMSHVGSLGISGEAAASDYWKKVLAEGQSATPTSSERWEIQSGSFVIASDIPAEPSLTCFYAVPAAKGGRISPRRNQAVYFFHTPNPKANILDNGLCNRLVAELGVTVFGVAFKESSESGLFYGNREAQQRFYSFAKSGSFNAMLTAWTVMRRQFSIPDKRFYLYGYSAGGIGVQRFAEEYPEFCAGIISVNGHSFTQKNQAKCPVLVIHSMGDGGTSSGLGLLRYYSSVGTPCERLLVSPSWERMKEGNDFAFHAMHGSVTDLAITYVDALIAMSNGRKPGDLLPTTAWPYVASADDPLVIQPLRGAASLFEVLSPEMNPMLIPSARFYAQMLENPLPPLPISTDAGEGILMRPRPDQPARGLIVLRETQITSATGEASPLSDNVVLDGQFLADHGFVALVTNQTGPQPQVMTKADRLIPGGAAALRLGNLVIDPLPGALGDLPITGALVVLFTKTVALDGYLEECQRLLKRGVRLQVLLPYRNRFEYDTALATVNPAIRTQMFPPFDPAGQNAELSIRQQQREAAHVFLDRWTRGR